MSGTCKYLPPVQLVDVDEDDVVVMSDAVALGDTPVCLPPPPDGVLVVGHLPAKKRLHTDIDEHMASFPYSTHAIDRLCAF